MRTKVSLAKKNCPTCGEERAAEPRLRTRIEIHDHSVSNPLVNGWKTWWKRWMWQSSEMEGYERIRNLSTFKE